MIYDDGNDFHWARVTIPANVRYDYGFHGGVDFSGVNQKVFSLIHGEVWACTYHVSTVNTHDANIRCLGRCMVIKDMNNDILYLLAHLDDYLVPAGSIIEPRQEVAKVGNTGFSDGAHLHVEAFRCSVTDAGKVLTISTMNQSWMQADAGRTNGLQYDKIKQLTSTL